MTLPKINQRSIGYKYLLNFSVSFVLSRLIVYALKPLKGFICLNANDCLDFSRYNTVDISISQI